MPASFIDTHYQKISQHDDPTLSSNPSLYFEHPIVTMGPPVSAINSELVFKHLVESLFVERMDQNEEIFVRYMNDASFQKVVTGWMADVVGGFHDESLPSRHAS